MKSHHLLATIVYCSTLCTLLHLAMACGPGRAGGRRRMMRKYRPLVVHEYIPNVSENTFGASGRPEGAIKRKDKRFRELVSNWNPDIVFRDEERTGADRLMSQRLKEKLSTLAISVMNQWPNVKLRVIEGWDEDHLHRVNSLHYEGRAVDITTSDMDRAKYGMLARLAVEAGFDWVHYESRSHVHCSVKSEKAETIKNNGCFDAAALVETPFGEMEMSQLQTNDLILTMNPRNGQLQYSPVIMWLDKDELGHELFVELRTESNRTIRLTSSHLIYVADEQPSVNQSPIDVVESPTGSGDNYQNNNYFHYNYEQTKSGSDNSGQSGTIAFEPDVPNSQSVNNKITSYSSSPASKPSASTATQRETTLDEVAFTTYARNAIVGQYLLMSESKSQQPNDRTDEFIPITDKMVLGSSSGTAEETVDSLNSKMQSRLTFVRDRESYSPIAQKISDDAQAQLPSNVKFEQIVNVNYVTRRGIYAPLTREGNIVVNSIVASCYAVISDHDWAHLSFAPVRWFSYLSEWLVGLKTRTPTTERTVEAIRKRSDDHFYEFIQDTQEPTATITQTNSDPYGTDTKTKQIRNRRRIHWYPLMLYRIARFLLPTRYLY